MCGIIGYVGDRQATDVIINGLKYLEYRGYDSAGIAVFGINEGFVYSPVTDEFNRLKADVEYFLSGKIDSWTMDKADLTAMKNDCKNVWDVYFKEN